MFLFTLLGRWCQSATGRQSSAPDTTLHIRAYELPRDWSPAASYGGEWERTSPNPEEAANSAREARSHPQCIHKCSQSSCLQSNSHMYMSTWWGRYRRPAAVSPTSSQWWTGARGGRRQYPSAEPQQRSAQPPSSPDGSADLESPLQLLQTEGFSLHQPSGASSAPPWVFLTG